ncbi:MAG: aminotransferase class IV [Flavobacteriaceae bacterium]|nr:aminotransferase class IV [Flavobacteriaceae bacterium]
MVNFNGTVLESQKNVLSADNRGFLYGDAVFETLRVVGQKPLFWEDHYFRLMASMRLMRMEIPMSFTPEFLLKELQKTLVSIHSNATRIRLTVFRNSGGRYLPTSNDVQFLIVSEPLENDFFIADTSDYLVDLFKDFYVPTSLLSSLKTNNRSLNVIGSRYAQDNDLDNCILLNDQKQVVEFLNGNLFVVQGKTIKTPPVTSGCIKGIVRKQLIQCVDNHSDFTLEEAEISPFELQKSDELWVTNAIQGIRPVGRYRKKNFANTVALRFVESLNNWAKKSLS